MSPGMLARGCNSGEIPVAMRQFGPRLRFVNQPQLDAWICEAKPALAMQQTSRPHADHSAAVSDAHAGDERNLFS